MKSIKVLLSVIFISVLVIVFTGCPRIIGKGEYEQKEAIRKNFDEAYFQYRAGEYELALASYEQILDVDSKFPETYYHIANCYRELDQLDKAFINAKKAVGLAPNNFDYQLLAGSIAGAQENYTEAMKYYGNAVSLSPNDFNANLYFGIAAFKAGDNAAAESAFDIAESIKQYDGLLLFNRAMFYEESGDIDKAEVYWRLLSEKAVNVDPSWKELAKERLESSE